MRKLMLATGALLLAVLFVGTLAMSGIGGAATPRALLEKRNANAEPSRALQLGETVTIAGKAYLVIDALQAINRIPNATVKTMATLIRRCRAVKAFGFATSNPVDVGVVVWLPTNPLACWTGGGVSGGGPTGGGPTPRDPCLQGFRTPDRRTFVIFAGSSSRICPQLSTQVPGGWPAQTNRPLQGLPQGTKFLVKCQAYDAQKNLLDYVAAYAAKLPGSKSAFWIYDNYVDTGGRSTLPGVPGCTGVSVSFS